MMHSSLHMLARTKKDIALMGCVVTPCLHRSNTAQFGEHRNAVFLKPGEHTLDMDLSKPCTLAGVTPEAYYQGVVHQI